MSSRLVAACGLAAAALLAGAGTANAQLGSVTGSLPGFATGPVGSTANAVCNVGSVANLAGVGLPIDMACKVLPAAGESLDMFFLGDVNGSISKLLGGVPYVGSALQQVVPTESAAEPIEGALAGAGIDPTEYAPSDSLGVQAGEAMAAAGIDTSSLTTEGMLDLLPEGVVPEGVLPAGN
ncbi:hypothetical protein [Dietzia sp. 179-F 9C3 NHS]|uniref:hypothetical protein n=1 Tax=Dietzia sp. 179-F 9C3 NHS TaxID=3374295 RepID=UPI003879FF57